MFFIKFFLPKKFYIFLKEKYFFFFYRILNNFNHEYNALSVNRDIHSHFYPIINLLDNNSFNINTFESNHLITCERDLRIKKKTNLKIIESWVLQKNKTYSDNPNHIFSQRERIYKSLISKNFRKYNYKIYLLPYYTNQYGHYIGEVFGSLLYYLELFKKRGLEEKILICYASINWLNFFKKYYPKNIIYFSEKTLLKKNITFNKSFCLPKFSTWQNYIITKNLLSKKIENNNYLHQKYFLTNESSERISNIKELIKFFISKKFKILNPSKIGPIELFKRLNSAKVLVTEKASISHNVHISRNRPYYLLLSVSDKVMNKKWYRHTGIYNNFHAGLARPIYCANDPEEQSVYNFQHRIKVDIKKLKEIL
jgi:hypothetical protein